MSAYRAVGLVADREEDDVWVEADARRDDDLAALWPIDEAGGPRPRIKPASIRTPGQVPRPIVAWIRVPGLLFRRTRANRISPNEGSPRPTCASETGSLFASTTNVVLSARVFFARPAVSFCSSRLRLRPTSYTHASRLGRLSRRNASR